MNTMNEQELQVFRARLADIVARGTEAEARAYIDECFPRLPEEAQREIVLHMLVTAASGEADDAETIADIQKEGLKAIETLEAIQKERARE